MRYILIPIKDLTYAKQRLSPLMLQAERTQLAWAMLENAFDVAAQTRNTDRVAVVTLYPPAIALAEKYGMEVILETEQVSESASVDFGSREVRKRGATAVLRLPIDLPLVTTADIEAILDREDDETPVVIVPSRDGKGTNAILRRPPDLFPSHFGPNSLKKHLEEASRLRVNWKVLHLERVALDIDDPADLRVFMQRGHDTPVYELLTGMCIRERLKSWENISTCLTSADY